MPPIRPTPTARFIESSAQALMFWSDYELHEKLQQKAWSGYDNSNKLQKNLIKIWVFHTRYSVGLECKIQTIKTPNKTGVLRRICLEFLPVI